MEEPTPIEEETTVKEGVASSKIHKHRSPNYPAIGLEKAIGRAKTLYDHARLHPIPVTTAHGLWNYKRGIGDQIVSALKSFGLVEVQGEKEGRQLRLSEAARRIIGNAPDRAEILKSSALKPDLHRELWEKYDGDLPADAIINQYLTWERNFNPNFVDDFIVQFRETLSFAKVNLSDRVRIENNENENQEEEMAPMNASSGGEQRGKQPPTPPLGQRDFPLYFTNSQKGSLYVPEEMSPKDYKLLKTQIENYLAIILATSVADEDEEKEQKKLSGPSESQKLLMERALQISSKVEEVDE